MTTTPVETPAALAQGDQIAAAVAAALPGALDAYFTNNMTGFVLAMDKAKDQLGKCKVFTGIVRDVKKEQSSTRGLITLYTGTDRAKDGVPEGCETLRTERTDNPEGLAMAKKVKGLIDHKVTVWVEVEEYGNGSGKVRVLRHVESRGKAD